VSAKSRIAVAAAIVLAAACTAFAKDSGPPRLDIDHACRASEQAVSAIFTVTSDIFASCKNDESDARGQLEKTWTTFPATDKARCIQIKEYLPSYVEWLTCLEMARDVKAMRKSQPGPSSTTDKCPVVRYLEDGTIVSVDAC
jgi:hypothetical protein